jgi:hypothetical protein
MLDSHDSWKKFIKKTKLNLNNEFCSNVSNIKKIIYSAGFHCRIGWSKFELGSDIFFLNSCCYKSCSTIITFINSSGSKELCY